MTAFNDAITFTLSPDIEGDLSEVTSDPGGITRWGISLRFALGVGDLDKNGRPDLDIDGDGDIDATDIRLLPKDVAVAVYRTSFWDACRCGGFPPRIGVALFDTAVNMGRGPAVAMLQEVLEVDRDGKPGPITQRAAWEAPHDATLGRYLDRRLRRYFALANREIFIEGWARRVLALSGYCLTRVPG